MADGRDKLKKLHQNLVSQGYDLPDYAQFEVDMADSNKLSKLHQNLVKEGYELPEWNIFREDMGYGVKKKSSWDWGEGVGIGSIVGGVVSQVGGKTAQSQTVSKPDVKKVKEFITGTKEQPKPLPKTIDAGVTATKAISRPTDEEVEEEAIRRFNSPLSKFNKSKQVLSNVQISDDPIGEQLNSIEQEKRPIVSSSLDQLDPQYKNNLAKANAEILVKNKQQELIMKYSIPDGDAGKDVLQQQVSKIYGGNIDNLPIEQVDKIRPKNTTSDLAFEKYEKKRMIGEAISTSRDLAEAAAKVYGTKKVKNGIWEGDAANGEDVASFLEEPELIALAAKDPSINREYQKTKANLYLEYPDYAEKKIATLISQKLEDERMTGWLYANPSLKKVEKAIELLKQDGLWGGKEQQVFDKNLKSIIAAGGADKVLKTTDLAHGFGTGFYEGVSGIESSMRDIVTNKILQGVPQQLGLVESNEDRTERLQKTEDNRTSVTPSTGFRKFIMGGSEFAGFMTPMILGGMAKVPHLSMAALQFEGINADKAMKDFPNDKGKQNLYTLLSTGIDVALMQLIPTKKAAEGVKRLFADDVKGVINQLSAKKITEQEAKQTITEKITNYLGKVVVGNTKTANALSAFHVAHNTVDAAFGKRNLKLETELNQAVENYLPNWLNSTFISGFSALAGKEPSSTYYVKMAENADKFRDIINKSGNKEQLGNLEHIEAVNDLLVKRGMKPGEREKYLQLSLQQKVKEEKVKKSPDKTVVSDDEKQIKLAEIDKERLLNPEMTNTEYLERLYKDDLLPKGSRMMLEDADKKFSPSKVGSYLKLIAQQSNNLDENWKPHEGKAPSLDKVPKTIVEIANEKWADDIAKHAENITEEFATEPVGEGEKGGNVSLESEEIQRQMKPITDKMASVERDFENEGYKIDWDYDSEIIITDKNGELVGPDELPNKLKQLAASYEQATQKLGEFDEKSFIQSLNDSRKLTDAEFEEVPEKQLPPSKAQPSTVQNDVVNLRNANTKEEITKAILKATNSDNITDALNDAENIIGKALYKSVYYSDPKKFANELADSIEKVTKKQSAQPSTVSEVKGVAFAGDTKKSEKGGDAIYLGTEELATSYAEGGGKVEKYEYTLKKPYVVEKDSDFDIISNIIDDYKKKNPEASWHPNTTNHINNELKKLGYDGLIIKESALQSEKGYEKIGGTYGEPQVVLFNKNQAKQISNETIPPENIPDKHSNIPPEEEIKPDTEATETSQAAEGAKEPPVEPPPMQKGSVFIERPSTELSHRGLQNVANEFSLPDVKTRDRKSDVQLRQDARETAEGWAEKGEYAERIEGLVKKAETGEILTDKERVILERHLANLSAELRNITDKKSPEFDDKLAEIHRLKKAGEQARSEAGAALRIMGGGSQPHPIEDYADAMVAKAEAIGSDVLTEKQKADVEAQLTIYEERAKAAEEKVVQMQQRMSELEAEKSLKSESVKIKKESGKKKTKEDYQKERQQFKDELREAVEEHKKWLQDQGIKQAGIDGIVLTPKMIKVIGKIVKSHVSEIGDNLKEVTKKVFEEIKDLFPGITDKDVHDVISGAYAQPKPTRTQLAIDLRSIQDEAKLINKLEALMRGEEPKTEKKKTERNRQITDLQNKIKEYRKGVFGLSDIEAIKKKNLDKEKEIRERLAKGDFEEKPKPASIFDNPELRKKYPKEYNEMLDAIVAKEDAMHDFDIALLKDAESKMTIKQKTGDYAKKFIATTKALKSGIDFSGVFVQNVVAIISHPRTASRAIPRMFSHTASEKRFNRWLAALHNNKPLWELMEKSGLDVTEPKSLKAEKKEEIFDNNQLNRSFKIWGKEYNIGKYITKPFERAFTSIGNSMRVELFLREAQRLYDEGKTIDTHEKDFQDIARVFNTETGRGGLHENVQKAREIVTAGIWSPKLVASRLNMLGLSDLASPFTGKGYYSGLSPRARAIAVKDVTKFIGTGFATMILFGAMGYGVDLDPESPTFGTIKIGNKRVNVFDGMSKYVRTIAQFVKGKKRVEGIEKPAKRGETVMKFFRGSTTPAAGVAWDVITGKDYMNRPITWGGELKQLAAPMSSSGMVESIKKDGVVGIAWGLGQILGLNITDERDFDEVRVPETILHNGKKIGLSGEAKEEFGKLVTENGEKYLTRLHTLKDYINADNDKKIKLDDMAKRQAVSDAEEVIKKKYPEFFPRQTIEEKKTKKVEERERKLIKRAISQ